MRLLAEWFPEFAEELENMDKLYLDKRTIAGCMMFWEITRN